MDECTLYVSITSVKYLISDTFVRIFSGFIAIGVIFDLFVWYLAKGIQIFDEPISFDKKENKDESHKMENVADFDELKVR